MVNIINIEIYYLIKVVTTASECVQWRQWESYINLRLLTVSLLAARLVLGLRPRDHVTAAFIDLHWLPVAARIEYKLCTLVYQSVTGNAPTYITDMPQPVSDLDRQTQLRSAQLQRVISLFHALDSNSANVHSELLLRGSGMNCHLTSGSHQHWRHLKSIKKISIL